MSKQETKSAAADLRSLADRDVARCRKFGTEFAEAFQQFNAASRTAERLRTPCYPIDGQTRLRVIGLQIRALELENMHDEAEGKASASTDAAELAEGDELMRRCDRGRLRAELSDLMENEKRLREE